jgi:hypothetical protein
LAIYRFASRNFDGHASNFQQAAQKHSEARPAELDELRRTLQYVEANRASSNEAYEGFSAACQRHDHLRLVGKAGGMMSSVLLPFQSRFAQPSHARCAPAFA